MGTFAESIRRQLHPTNPFDGFDYQKHPRDLGVVGAADAMNALLQQAFAAVKPQLIVEIGTWKGASACQWAAMLKKAGIDGAVLCVDTWLGGLEHISGWSDGTPWDLRPFLEHGQPIGLYHQFLANVMHERHEDVIVPLPNTSAIAARWLASKNLSPQLVYVDGSHDELDVYADLTAYWPLIPIGGVICGDDWSSDWAGVITAVTRFTRQNGLRLQTLERSWAIQKTLTPEAQYVVDLLRREQSRPPQPTT